MYIYIYIDIYIYIHTHTYIYIYIYIHRSLCVGSALRPPARGRVSGREACPGSYAPAGEPLFRDGGLVGVCEIRAHPTHASFRIPPVHLNCNVRGPAPVECSRAVKSTLFLRAPLQ